MEKDSKIYLAGHRGMVGAAIWRVLKKKGYSNLIGRTSKELDLRNQKAVFDFIKSEKPDVVIDAAARVGGILANNNYPFQFLMENMQIQNNLIDAAHKLDVKKFIFLGSSCIYPKLAPQPLKEEYLLTDSLEPTNEWYAIAKITGVKACQAIRKQFGKDFVSLMPTNLYGTHDNFDLETCHVVPALIKRVLNGEEPFVVWGNPDVVRDFLYVKDVVNGALLVLEKGKSMRPYNLGYGSTVTVGDIVECILKVSGLNPEVYYNESKPTTIPFRMVSTDRIVNELGFKPLYTFEEGMKETVEWYCDNK